jgi:RimJ/RimL family protein N-acetyltransferase
MPRWRKPAVFHCAAPRLETERLILRAIDVADYESLHANWADPIVYKYILGRPSTREDSWDSLIRYMGYWPALGYGFWAVAEKSSGRYIGEIGVADFRRNIIPSLEGRPEFGWILAPSAHGKGYASEALKVITVWVDQNLETEFTCCITDPDNVASNKLAKKIGFIEIAKTTYHDKPTLIYEKKRRI